MPFKSEKQRRYLWMKEPGVAARWSEKYGGKVATDGQVDTNDNVRGKTPPFMKGRKPSNGDEAQKAKSAAAQRRLEMMKKSGK